MKRVAYLPASVDACALYRMYIPHLHTEDSEFILEKQGFPIQRVEGYEIATVQRLMSRENLNAINLMRERDIKVIFDLDDDLWNMAHTHPMRKVFRQYREGIEVCASRCNLITVSTNPLKAALSRNLRKTVRKVPVVVIQNMIDFDLFKSLPSLRKERVRIGWGGSSTHSADLSDVLRSVNSLVRANRNTEFELIGEFLPDYMERCSRINTKPFVPVSAYPARFSSWRWDIMLAPLKNTPFNRSKSNIKMLEAAAIKIPVLVSPVAPYLDFVSLNKELEWLVCFNQKQWESKLKDLVYSSEQRRYYGNLLYKVAKEHFDVLGSLKDRERIYESLC